MRKGQLELIIPRCRAVVISSLRGRRWQGATSAGIVPQAASRAETGRGGVSCVLAGSMAPAQRLDRAARGASGGGVRLLCAGAQAGAAGLRPER